MTPSPASFFQTGLSLLLVLALILICAWLIKRSQRAIQGSSPLMKVRAQLMVGPRERIVLLEVGDQWIVAGVGGGQVRPLAVLPRQEVTENLPESPLSSQAFSAVLSRFIHKP